MKGSMGHFGEYSNTSKTDVEFVSNPNLGLSYTGSIRPSLNLGKYILPAGILTFVAVAWLLLKYEKDKDKDKYEKIKNNPYFKTPTKEEKLVWLIQNRKSWENLIPHDYGRLGYVGDWQDDSKSYSAIKRIVEKMKDEGLYSPTTYASDIKLKKLIIEARRIIKILDEE